MLNSPFVPLPLAFDLDLWGPPTPLTIQTGTEGLKQAENLLPHNQNWPKSPHAVPILLWIPPGILVAFCRQGRSLWKDLYDWEIQRQRAASRKASNSSKGQGSPMSFLFSLHWKVPSCWVPSQRRQCQLTYSWKLHRLNYSCSSCHLAPSPPHHRSRAQHWLQTKGWGEGSRVFLRSFGPHLPQFILLFLQGRHRHWGEGCVFNPGQMVAAFSHHLLRF